MLLPKDVIGYHGAAGVRKDGRNLIEYARGLGYHVVYTRDQMNAIPAGIERVLGIFSSKHTFTDETEEDLKKNNLPHYLPTAPTVAEMTAFALSFFEKRGEPFFIVAEEEGTDNFSNKNNATGSLEALRRADQAIGVVQNYIKRHPNTMLITTADSDAGSMKIISVRDSGDFNRSLPATTENGAPIDGRNGTNTLPFVAKPDQYGTELRFSLGWVSRDDLGGGVIAKAHGLNATLLPNNVDNTDIYRMMYATLFGEWLK